MKILNKFNLKINKGEIIAFTGEFGCGKSTLFKLQRALRIACADGFVKELV